MLRNKLATVEGLIFFKQKYQATYQVQYRFIDLVLVYRLAAALKKISSAGNMRERAKAENSIKCKVCERSSCSIVQRVSWYDSSSARNIPLYMYCGPSIAVFVNALLSITLDSLVIKNCIIGECKAVNWFCDQGLG